MVKVTIVGAAGGIGQPLSLLAKLNTDVTALSLYDVVPGIKGVACDLSHIPTPAAVTPYTGDQLGAALKDADIVLIPAGVPRKPGMTRDDLLNVNAKILGGIAKEVALNAPKALVGVITNPVNSMVPMFVEILVKHGVERADAERRTLGVTTLDTLRARTFLAGLAHVSPSLIEVPVVGGHAGTTIVPLFSQTTPFAPPVADAAAYAALVKRTQFGGDEVVEAKEGAGSATLSMASAADVFLKAAVKARLGVPTTLCAYVRSDVLEGCEYFASKINLGSHGILHPEPVGPITAQEQELLKPVKDQLVASVKSGKELAARL